MRCSDTSYGYSPLFFAVSFSSCLLCYVLSLLLFLIHSSSISLISTPSLHPYFSLHCYPSVLGGWIGGSGDECGSVSGSEAENSLDGEEEEDGKVGDKMDETIEDDDDLAQVSD